MQRYFVNEKYTNQSSFVITGENYHHMVRVMRMKPKERIYLVFDNGVAVVGEITAVNEQDVVVAEVSKEEATKELPVNVSIACGLPKGDKLEWITQKGTELGGHQFIGFPAKHSIVKWDHKKRGNKTKRLQKIAQEAAEQSHRQVIPEIRLLESFQELLGLFSAYTHVLIAYEESAKQGERTQLAETLMKLAPGDSLLVIFGPEGGFDPAEIELFEQFGGVHCGLGPRILRAETAPLYLLSAVSYQLEML